jgi:hypothetical protein
MACTLFAPRQARAANRLVPRDRCNCTRTDTLTPIRSIPFYCLRSSFFLVQLAVVVWCIRSVVGGKPLRNSYKLGEFSQTLLINGFQNAYFDS